MTTVTKDRDYYRSQEIKDLLDEVKYAINPDWQELAIVLAERLKEAEWEVKEARYNRGDYG